VGLRARPVDGTVKLRDMPAYSYQSFRRAAERNRPPAAAL